MKLIIAGTRTFDDYSRLLQFVGENVDTKEITEIVSGGANGADKLGEVYAETHNIPFTLFEAKWELYDKAAGPIRNKKMAEYGDVLIACWDGISSGTKNMIDCMTRLNKPVHVLTYSKKLNAFQVYQKYLAVKMHFETDSYDYFKHRGKTRATPQSLGKRRDRFFFELLAKKYYDEELTDMFLANIVDADALWIGEALNEKYVGRYAEWKKKIQSLTYNFQQDIQKLQDYCNSRDIKYVEIFKPKDGEIPQIFTLYSQNLISIETMTILNDIMNLDVRWKDKINDTIVYPDQIKKITKYTPFISKYYNKTKIKDIIKNHLIDS